MVRVMRDSNPVGTVVIGAMVVLVVSQFGCHFGPVANGATYDSLDATLTDPEPRPFTATGAVLSNHPTVWSEGGNYIEAPCGLPCQNATPDNRGGTPTHTPTPVPAPYASLGLAVALAALGLIRLLTGEKK